MVLIASEDHSVSFAVNSSESTRLDEDVDSKQLSNISLVDFTSETGTQVTSRFNHSCLKETTQPRHPRYS
jgi:hypothetical protein